MRTRQHCIGATRLALLKAALSQPASQVARTELAGLIPHTGAGGLLERIADTGKSTARATKLPKIRRAPRSEAKRAT